MPRHGSDGLSQPALLPEPDAAPSRGERASGFAQGSVRKFKEKGTQGADWLRGVCTCRCSPQASLVIVLAVFGCMVGGVVVSHVASGKFRLRGPPPPPPLPCGSWPTFEPCSSCIHGANASVRHRVMPGETCETIGNLYGVPQFDLFIRNRSIGCCEAGDGGVRPTDLVDLCNMPTREQWRAEGHPRVAPDTGVVLSFLGMQPAAHRIGKSLPPPKHLSPAINVAVLYSVIDVGSTGNFRINPVFTGNCTTFIDPTMVERHDGGAQDTRVWLASLDIAAGNWNVNGAITPDQWGTNAAASLEKIILRYRLDGIDVNIEMGRTNFGLYMCAMFKHLRAIDPKMITTLTPWGQRWSMYSQVGACKDDLSWANYQTYSDQSFRPCSTVRVPYRCAAPNIMKTLATTYGGGVEDWSKVAWGISTESAGYRPDVRVGIAFQQQLQEQYPAMRGAMVWTAEFSSVCSPPWCYDELLGRAMAGEELSVEEMNNCVCDGRADPSGGGHGRRRRRLLGLDPNASKSENKQ